MVWVYNSIRVKEREVKKMKYFVDYADAISNEEFSEWVDEEGLIMLICDRTVTVTGWDDEDSLGI